jgi:hypothetical protein
MYVCMYVCMYVYGYLISMCVFIRSAPETALRELLQPILNLARLITARQLAGAEGDARAMFAKWNIDGLWERFL